MHEICRHQLISNEQLRSTQWLSWCLPPKVSFSQQSGGHWNLLWGTWRVSWTDVLWDRTLLPKTLEVCHSGSWHTPWISSCETPRVRWLSTLFSGCPSFRDIKTWLLEKAQTSTVEYFPECPKRGILSNCQHLPGCLGSLITHLYS